MAARAKTPKPAPKAKRGKNPVAAANGRTLGRPRIHGPEVEAEICARLAAGETLTSICSDPRMPNISTVCCWADDERPAFAQAYAKAREARAERLVDEMLELADRPSTDSVEAMDKRIRVDARKWLVQKLFRRVYGDRIQTDVQQLDRNGNPTDPATVNVMVLAADKLDTDELRVLVALYRKMGIRLPHEPEPITIEHDGGDDE
ncbi:MAG: hypothetical protein B7Z76_14230 [Acidiphilium sp. 20-67-58]|uniref:terminase small subunit-like protein n=1 Tax=Acidiphilium sp. 20-67-58 TaxID=1970291 RepID=UPI000BC8BF11|nr:hypothetical protein [Acidiphilium sp. 20-67-58]OYV54529.1 MAG: hypothetical protein B7Z76_14230 [Acidiphilium sp. 20-67-58]